MRAGASCTSWPPNGCCAGDVLLAAEHFERAEDPRAASAYLQASEEQARQYHTTEALALVERALKLPDQAGQGFALTLARARLLLAIGHAGQAIEASGQAIGLAQSGAERALALIAMASGMRLVDRISEGLDLLQEAEPLAVQAGLTLDLSRLHELRGNLLFALGRSQECQQEHQKALELAREAGSAEAECAALGGLGDASYALARVQTGARLVGQCVDDGACAGFSQGRDRLPAHGVLVGLLHARPAACDGGEPARHRSGQPHAQPARRADGALAQLVMVDGCIRGNHSEALDQVDRSLEIGRDDGRPAFRSRWSGFSGPCWCCAPVTWAARRAGTRVRLIQAPIERRWTSSGHSSTARRP